MQEHCVQAPQLVHFSSRVCIVYNSGIALLPFNDYDLNNSLEQLHLKQIFMLAAANLYKRNVAFQEQFNAFQMSARFIG